MDKNIKLSIAIVNFNTCDFLINCIESIIKTSLPFQFEIIVIDNASTDGSADAVRKQFPNVKLVVNTENLYMSKAYNQAFSLAQGEFFFIVSSDIQFLDNVIDKMVKTLNKNLDYGGIGSRMYFLDGKLQKICSMVFPLKLAFYNFTVLGKLLSSRFNKLFQDIFYAIWDRTTSRVVEVIPDSLLLIRSSLFENKLSSLYDENLFLYFTENDLCMKIQQKGFKLFYLAEGRTIHQESQSVRKVNPALISRIYRSDIKSYFSKYYGKKAALSLSLLIQLTCIVIRILRRLRIYKFKKNLVWGT